MTSPYAAEPDNGRLRAGIVDGTVDPAGVNVRALMAEVVAERDAVITAVRAKERRCRQLAATAMDSDVREWCTAFAADLRALLPDTHDHADAAGAGGGM